MQVANGSNRKKIVVFCQNIEVQFLLQTLPAHKHTQHQRLFGVSVASLKQLKVLLDAEEWKAVLMILRPVCM